MGLVAVPDPVVSMVHTLRALFKTIGPRFTNTTDIADPTLGGQSATATTTDVVVLPAPPTSAQQPFKAVDVNAVDAIVVKEGSRQPEKPSALGYTHVDRRDTLTITIKTGGRSAPIGNPASAERQRDRLKWLVSQAHNGLQHIRNITDDKNGIGTGAPHSYNKFTAGDYLWLELGIPEYDSMPEAGVWTARFEVTLINPYVAVMDDGSIETPA